MCHQQIPNGTTSKGTINNKAFPSVKAQLFLRI